MNRINRSVRLFQTAFAIFSREKKLLLFPFIATALGLVLALFFIAPVALYPTGHPYSSAAHWSAIGERISQAFPRPVHSANHPVLTNFATGFGGGRQVLLQHWWMTLSFAIAYFVSMFLGTFCNVAFYHEIMQALNGQAVSIRRGFRFAKTRWRAIMMWSLFAGLVGYLIQFIEQRVGFLGRIVTAFIGFAWSVTCVFIIPTLVRDTETTNPLELLRHSAGTLKRTWGELVVGFVGLDIVFIFIIIPVLIMISFMGGVVGHGMMPGLLVSLIFLTVIPLFWLKKLVNALYRCALFIYATEGVIPEPFDKELLDSAWKVK